MFFTMLSSAAYSSLIQSWVKLQRQWSNDEPPRWSIDSSTTPPTLVLNHHARLFSKDNATAADIFGANDGVEERGDRRKSTSSHMDEDLTSSFETEIESDQLAATTTTTTSTTTTTTEPQERPSLSLTIQICYDQGELIFFLP